MSSLTDETQGVERAWTPSLNLSLATLAILSPGGAVILLETVKLLLLLLQLIIMMITILLIIIP